MKLLTTNQIHVVCCDGKYYNASDAIINYDYMTRYTQYCPDVTALVRCRDVDRVEPSYGRVDGPNVSVCPLPDPTTPRKGLLGLPGLIRHIVQAARRSDLYYLKMPDAMATVVGLVLWCTGRPYAVEVVADCQQGILYAKGDMPLVRFYAQLFDGLTRFLVKRAQCATYISNYLQKRYPGPGIDREWLFCSVELTDDFMGDIKAPEFFKTTPFKLIAAGRQSAEKGHIHLVNAFQTIQEKAKQPVELHLLGDGAQRACLKQRVRELQLTDSVYFHGTVPRGPDLFAHLDTAQLYVLPSLTEGMGRGLIEAMARGLPCVASAVGGVPEYLGQDYLFESGDPQAIAAKVLSVMDDPHRLAAMSQHNIDASQAYTPEALKAVKEDFWRAVKEL